MVITSFNTPRSHPYTRTSMCDSLFMNTGEPNGNLVDKALRAELPGGVPVKSGQRYDNLHYQAFMVAVWPTGYERIVKLDDILISMPPFLLDVLHNLSFTAQDRLVHSQAHLHRNEASMFSTNTAALSCLELCDENRALTYREGQRLARQSRRRRCRSCNEFGILAACLGR